MAQLPFNYHKSLLHNMRNEEPIRLEDQIDVNDVLLGPPKRDAKLEEEKHEPKKREKKGERKDSEFAPTDRKSLEPLHQLQKGHPSTRAKWEYLNFLLDQR